MKTRHCTETVIAELINAAYGKNLTAREKYVHRESLRSLVRLAKSELALEMKTSVRKLVGPLVFTQPRQKTKSGQRIDAAPERRQHQLEFNQFD